ncbi:MAG TPA: ABC transporter permease [Micromonosporaceae bacterium]|jgi:ABC-type transport system involved in multi-copper enzyme maturation permease subunit
MTTTTPQLARPIVASSGSKLMHQIRSERIKITSTKTWWLFSIGLLVLTGLSLLVNTLNTNSDLSPSSGDPVPADVAVRDAATIFTSGQYFGGLFVMLLAILIVTNEFYHQTATSTFLATPHRSVVVGGKLLVGIACAVVVWIGTTVLDLIVGVLFFNGEGISNHLGDSSVLRAIVVNLMVFALWAVFGIGFGALIRSQIGATVTAVLLYTIGVLAVEIVFAVIHRYLWHSDHVYQAAVLVPGIAAQIAVSSTPVDINGAVVHWYWGAIVLLAYGIIMGAVGTLILRKRDIS